jgi:tetratricopeptide (TPR) repeat protein
VTQLDSTKAVVEEAVNLQKAGRTEAAERLYRLVLEACPQHAEANHNLGIISIQRGQLIEGVAYFERAFEAEKDRALYRRSYARSLAMCGQPDLATEVVRAGEANEWLQRGNELTEEGKFTEAIEAFQRAIALDSRLSDAYSHLGPLLIESGRVAEGFGYLMKRAELVNSRCAIPQAPQAEALHKRKHDTEQRDYLISEGRIPATTTAPSVFHIGDGARLADAAVCRHHSTDAILEKWRASRPQLVVIDDFLTPTALQQLRHFCADSTVWRRVYDAGYLGATLADGFACPLLAQVTEEIGIVYHEILAGHAFRYLGAFKYDSELSTGTNIHADFSAINLNLYITPDEANLDPDRGGMVIWNKAARDERELRRYNGNHREIRDYLRDSQVEAVKVAHRANRAVFFASNLFHKTDTCRFKEGYLNKRINVSFLFGRFGSGNASEITGERVP